MILDTFRLEKSDCSDTSQNSVQKIDILTGDIATQFNYGELTWLTA